MAIGQKTFSSGVFGAQSLNNSTLENIRQTFSAQQPHTDTFSFWLWDLIHSSNWIYISAFIEIVSTILFTLLGIYIGKKIKSPVLSYIKIVIDRFDIITDKIADLIVDSLNNGNGKGIDETE
jgi:hypothetical protein